MTSAKLQTALLAAIVVLLVIVAIQQNAIISNTDYLVSSGATGAQAVTIDVPEVPGPHCAISPTAGLGAIGDCGVPVYVVNQPSP